MENLFDIPDFRNRTAVFKDRKHAGVVLGEMLSEYRGSNAVIYAIPAGGVPIGALIALKLNIPLEVAIVSKITLPWNTEAGYGAVAFDGTIRLNRGIIERIGLTKNDVEEGIEKTRKKVQNRVQEFQKGKSKINIQGMTAILVDDGIASGFTMIVAIEALKNSGAGKIIIAVPTAHLENIKQLLSQVDAVYCPNIRSGWSFAVADAYQYWSDVSEGEVMDILNDFSGF
jgi:predicted phosphoribosyltransferase